MACMTSVLSTLYFSMAAYEAQGKAEKRGERLKERRDKLALLLAEEREMYEVKNLAFCTFYFEELVSRKSSEILLLGNTFI